MNLKHHFLIAMPALTGTYFGGTITYVCEHSEDGALGLMVNRPSDLSLAELCEQSDIEAEAAEPPDLSEVMVLEGGPVSSQQGFVLHSADGRFATSTDLGEGVYISTALDMLTAIANGRGPYHYLVALGYAGWGPGQLEDELGDNAWLTCPANLDILFDVPFDDRVQEAAATLGIDFSLISGQAGHA